MTQDFKAYCDCPISCHETHYNPQVSYTQFVDAGRVVERLNEKFYGTPEGSESVKMYGDSFYQ